LILIDLHAVILLRMETWCAVTLASVQVFDGPKIARESAAVHADVSDAAPPKAVFMIGAHNRWG
jgi:hypothetical protein